MQRLSRIPLFPTKHKVLVGFTRNPQLYKYYTGFELGNKVVFDVNWISTKNWCAQMKIPPEIAEIFHGETWKYQKYDATFKNSEFRIIPKKIDISELHEMLIAAYPNVSGLYNY